jgi:DHA2 family multidrug resistance protein
MAWRSVIGSIVAVLMSIMDMQITNAAIGPLQAAMHAPLADGSWISSAYLIAEIVTLPLTAWFSRLLGFKRYAALFSLLFMLASVLCAQAWSFESLIAFRVLQGIAGGALMPLAYSLIMTKLPNTEHGKAMSLFGAMVTLAPTLGPLIAGVLTDRYGWPSIFYINLPIGVVALALMMNGLRDDRPDPAVRARIDLVSLVAIVAGLGCLQYVLEEGQPLGWFSSPLIICLSVIAVVALYGFVVRQWRAEHPLVVLTLLRNRQLLIACAANVTTGAAIFGTYFLVPYMLIALQQYTPSDISLVILYGGAVQLSILAFLPRILRRYHVYAVVTLGAALSCCSALVWSRAAVDFSYEWVVGAQLLRGLGFTMMLTPLGVLATTATSKSDAPSSSILFNISRSLGGAIGVALLTAMIAARRQVYLDAPGRQGIAFDSLDHGSLALAFRDTFALTALLLAVMAAGFVILSARRLHSARDRDRTVPVEVITGSEPDR